MVVRYPVIFTDTADEKQTVLVQIPDFNHGGVTEGFGMKDAVLMAQDYIKECCLDMTEYPVPTNIEDIDLKKACFVNEGQTFVREIEVDLEKEYYSEECDES